MLIQLVVGELDFLKGHHLLQQLLSCEWGVRVHVQPRNHRDMKTLTSWLAHNTLLSGCAVVSQMLIS